MSEYALCQGHCGFIEKSLLIEDENDPPGLCPMCNGQTCDCPSCMTDGMNEIIQERDALSALINTPELLDFSSGVVREAAHQRVRWPSEQDAGKAPSDWFWLVGYLAGKALAAAIAGDRDKALHHCISTAAALANWHAALLGANNSMRPGIDTPEGMA